MHENSYCFQRVLAIAILPVRLSVCLSITQVVDQSKNGASWDRQIFTVGCLEDSSFRPVKLFHKLKGSYPELGH